MDKHPGKLQHLIDSQTAPQRARYSTEIEHIVHDLVPEAIRQAQYKYGAILSNRLGMTADDVLNEIRVECWKALLTHEAVQSNLKTYVKRLIENRMKSLVRRAFREKNQMIDYLAESP